MNRVRKAWMVVGMSAATLMGVPQIARADHDDEHCPAGASESDMHRGDSDGERHREDASRAGRGARVVLRVDSADIASSICADGTVSLSIPLQNWGNTDAQDVTIRSIRTEGGSYAGPAHGAFGVGTITAGDDQVFNAIFTMQQALAGNKPLFVRGTYRYRGHACDFDADGFFAPPRPGNGGQPKYTTRAPVFTVGTAIYAPPMPHPSTDSPNAETEYFPPIGRPQYLFGTPPASSILDTVRAFRPDIQNPPPGSGPNDVVFIKNQYGGTTGGSPPDPNAAGATPGGFVLTSANTFVSYS